MNKTDEILSSFNILLSTTADRITPNIILWVTVANGFMLGFLTTGFLKEPMEVFSFQFAFYVLQFAMFFFLSSRHVNLTTDYLFKFFLSGVIGYYIQWQSFGYYAQNYDPEMYKSIQPIMDGGSGTFIFILFVFMGAKHCFSGNEVKKETKINTDI